MATSSSAMQKKVPRWAAVVVFVATLGGIWTAFEIGAQRTALRDIVGTYRDPDHRLPPGDQKAETNSDGLRCALEAGEIPEDGVRIFFLGDSFVFGVQTELEQALPQRFERGLREAHPEIAITVVNAAWPSASPYLGLRLLEDLGEKYRPDIVVYGFDMTDFRDDSMYENLLQRRGVYRLASVAPATLWLTSQALRKLGSESLYQRLFRMPSDRFFAVNRPLEQSRVDLESSWRHLVALHEYSTLALKADFYLVVLPRNFQYSDRESPMSWERGEYANLGEHVFEPFRFFAEKAPTAPFVMSSLLPAFQNSKVFPTCFAGDPHWTPAGTEVAARGLLRIAADQDWIESLD